MIAVHGDAEGARIIALHHEIVEAKPTRQERWVQTLKGPSEIFFEFRRQVPDRVRFRRRHADIKILAHNFFAGADLSPPNAIGKYLCGCKKCWQRLQLEQGQTCCAFCHQTQQRLSHLICVAYESHSFNPLLSHVSDSPQKIPRKRQKLNSERHNATIKKGALFLPSPSLATRPTTSSTVLR